MSNVIVISPEQAQRALLLCYKATMLARKMNLPIDVPVCLVGDTGVGKTTLVREFCNKIGRQFKDKGVEFGYWKTVLSMIPPEDIGGIPREEKGKIVHAVLKCLPFDCDDHGVIFMDEFDRSTTETQNSALQFLLGGDYHGHSLSRNAYSICAINGTSDTYTTPLSEAARTRMCTLFIDGKANDGSYDRWSKKNGLPEICRVFNTQFRDSIVSSANFEELAVCKKRTIDMAGVVTMARSLCTFDTEDIYRAVIAGIIGVSALGRWVGIEDAMAKNVNIDDIIHDPSTAEVDEDISLHFYTLSACIGKVRDQFNGDIELVRNLVRYALRFESMELTECWVTSLSTEFPDLVNSKIYKKWESIKADKGI